MDVAAALEANEQFIVLENDADIETAREAGYDESLVARLALKPSKVGIYFNYQNFFYLVPFISMWNFYLNYFILIFKASLLFF